MARRTPAGLAGLSKLLKAGSPKVGMASLPNGTYQGEITSVVLGQTQKKDSQVDWTLKVLSGEFEGRLQHKYDMCSTQENIDWLLGTLETLEVKEMPEDDKEFAAILKKQVGKKVEFSCRVSGDFTNVYINELLEEVPDGDSIPEIGDRVTISLDDDGNVDANGTPYPGAITSVDEDEETVNVEFDDSDTLDDIPFSDVTDEE